MTRRMSRRVILRGAAGTVLGLPFLESIGTPVAHSAVTDPFAIFVVHANGVQQGHFGSERDRFWPTSYGALTAGTMANQAVDELSAHRDRLLVVSGVNHCFYTSNHNYGGSGLLTAQNAINNATNRLVGGESLDWRIARELNPMGGTADGRRESLFLYAGPNDEGYIGANISYSGPRERRAPQRSPYEAYLSLVGNGGSTSQMDLLVRRRRSVNDLIRPQLMSLLGTPRLSASDRDRIEQHLAQVRDLEVQMSQRLSTEDEASLDRVRNRFSEETEAPEVARLHMAIAALAVVSGFTRSVAIQFGGGQDNARYELDGQRLENFHYISHRARDHSSTNNGFPEAEMQHHRLDRMFLSIFGSMLDRLEEYGALDDGVCVWSNNLAEGPSHSMDNLPFVLAGSCQGVLQQGQYIDAGGVKQSRLLNTLGSAVGVRDGGGPLENFGQSGVERGLIDGMLATRPW